MNKEKDEGTGFDYVGTTHKLTNAETVALAKQIELRAQALRRDIKKALNEQT